MRPAPTAVVLVGALACCAVALALAGRSLSEPGLYYDEAIQAGPAIAFVRGEDEPFRIPGARATRVLGRWLPWMTQPYMGALKSQLLIPVFAVAEPDVSMLRGVTLCWALLGIPLVMLFANRALGAGAALVAGALLAVDPALLFLGRHDWGSFSLGFLLRAASLPLLYGAFAGAGRGGTAAAALGGICLGLGLYNKIDFGVTLAAAAISLLLVAPGAVVGRLVERQDRVLALVTGFAAGVLPLAFAAGDALSVTESAARAGSDAEEIRQKLVVLRAVLDGSYFQQLMRAGGRFDAIGHMGAETGFGFFGLVVAVPTAALLLWVRRERGARERAAAWVLLTLLLAIGGILLTPRAVRAHHFLNVYPFPQFAIAVAAALLWDQRARITRIPARAAAVLLVGAVGLSAWWVDAATLRLLRESGGRGLWTPAIETLAADLPAGTKVVSLDWGFDAPLRFFAPELDTEEIIWRLRRGGETRVAGESSQVYLVHDREFSVFPYGSAFFDAVHALPPDVVQITTHTGRKGSSAFYSVRIAAPHELVYRGGTFRVELR